MIAIKPITIDASAIALTSAQDAPAWSASVSYALGAQVSYQDGTYQSAADGNLGNTPDASPTMVGARRPTQYAGHVRCQPLHGHLGATWAKRSRCVSCQGGA